MKKEKTVSKIDAYSFLGVFLLGLALVLITGNYYLNKEADEDRDARGRRIATELEHLPEFSVPHLSGH